ncbi:hypothetical protein ULF88_03955 [Halopseudomonas pachastrellae]|nr:hypothetical protein [Halopseudomonas pachastrellae]
MGYLASPLWFGFLVLTTVEVARLVLWPINYFPQPNQLFPLWPEWHPTRALALVGFTLILLFVPKLLALADVLISGQRRRYARALRLCLSVLLESLASALLAPIRMLAHSRYVVEALFNVNLRWAGQNRSGETSWLAAVLDQGIGSLLALSWSAFAYWLQPMFFLWSLPVAVPLVLAAPLFVLFSRIGIGTWLRDRGLLLSPDEHNGNALLDALEQPSSLPDLCKRDAFVEAVIHPTTQQLQAGLAHAPRARRQQQELQLLRQRCLEQGPEQLEPAHKQLLAADAQSLRWLHEQVWLSAADSPWGRRLANRIAH